MGTIEKVEVLDSFYKRQTSYVNSFVLFWAATLIAINSLYMYKLAI